jgi:hypothetical protein
VRKVFRRAIAQIKNRKAIPKKFSYDEKKLDKIFSNYVTLIEATKALSYFNHEKKNYGNSKKTNSKKTGSEKTCC